MSALNAKEVLKAFREQAQTLLRLEKHCARMARELAGLKALRQKDQVEKERLLDLTITQQVAIERVQLEKDVQLKVIGRMAVMGGRIRVSEGSVFDSADLEQALASAHRNSGN